ncbi:unnamed protein product [Thlaspi arvense]|uniref:peptidyl-tRNA hydrolase n=1 Tax=Thlaspi arvense TaxID=13288 RepID=A0AAU9STG9_THLAR|nr:unnamed protein product [Thlaspi arvense]
MQSCNFRFIQKACSSSAKSTAQNIGCSCSWEECAQPKVVVKIDGEDEMLELQWIVVIEICFGSTALMLFAKFNLFRALPELPDERAKSLKLPTHITIDAGRTQIAPNSRTVMAILDSDGQEMSLRVADCFCPRVWTKASVAASKFDVTSLFNPISQMDEAERRDMNPTFLLCQENL